MDWQKWFSEFPEWIIYLSPEIFIDDSLWSTSGGLGIVGHSFLRASHRLHLPVVGVTIRWRSGFYLQKVGVNGMEHEYVEHRSDERLLDTGIKVRVQIGGNHNVLLKVGIIPPGVFETVPIICLDADIEENDAVSRENTKKLYPADNGQKFAQMIVLGIGGARAIRALGIPVKLFHSNEPYGGLVAYELLSQKMAEGLDFQQALGWVKEKFVFTTHTPVIIGEAYDLETMINLGCFPDLNQEGHPTREQIAYLGRTPAADGRSFSPIAFCLRTAKKANAVSQLHAETSRQMLAWVNDGCPILAITNGVDVPFWQLPEFAEAKTPEAVKQAKLRYKTLFFEEIQRQYLWQQLSKVFQTCVLTIGSGRRWQDYKRPWFCRELNSADTQNVLSGKPHLSDWGMLRLWNETWQMSKTVANLAILVENGYAFKRLMKAGVDVWLLSSRRPWEACEDCFMSAMMNGAVVMASRDAGPLEIDPGHCFLFGVENPCSDIGEQDYQDLQEAKQVLPGITGLFYSNEKAWYRMALESKEEAEEKFSAERMLRDYISKLYF